MHARWVRFAPLVTLLLGSRSWAATHFASPGDDLQAKINAASDGDTVFLRDGRYDTCIVLNKRIKLMGRGPASTTIQCADAEKPTVAIINSLMTESGVLAQVAGLSLRHTAGHHGLLLDGAQAGITQVSFSNFDGLSPALLTDESAALFDGVEFRNNTVEGSGGALRANASLLFASNSTFDGNSATLGGGAIDAFDADITLAGCTLTGNSTPTDGGAIRVQRSESASAKVEPTLAVYQSVLENNEATRGGALALFNGTIRLYSRSNEWVGNAATDDGGAAFIDGRTPETSQGAYFLLDTFEANIAGGRGGAIHQTGALAISEISHFTANDAQYGGAVSVDHGNYSSRADAFDQNSATEDGGAAFVTESYLYSYLPGHPGFTVEESRFEENQASRGGAVAAQVSHLNIARSAFRSNEATSGGGAIFSSSRTSPEYVYVYTSLEESRLEENIAHTGSGGAALVENGANLTMQNSEADGNRADSAQGGAIAANSSGAIYVFNSSLTSNSAETGGAVSVVQAKGAAYGSSLYAAGSRLIKNAANVGAAVYTDYADTTVFQCGFAENEGQSTGAVHVAHAPDFDVLTSLFCANSAKTGTGGALYMDDAQTSDIRSNLWIDNYASSSGAAASAITDAALSPTSRWYGNTFLGNRTDDETTGVLYSERMRIDIDDSIFAYNDTATMSSPVTTPNSFLYRGIVAWPDAVAAPMNNPNYFKTLEYANRSDREPDFADSWTDDGTCFNDQPRTVRYWFSGIQGYGVGLQAYDTIRSGDWQAVDTSYTVNDNDGDGYTPLEGDCDDGDFQVFPGAEEVPGNYANEDCLLGSSWDTDQDGFHATVRWPFFTYQPIECDDANADIFPGATETYNDGINSDCAPDATHPGPAWASDYDPDADGRPSAQDCDSTRADIRSAREGYPAPVDVPWDGLDQDCVGGDRDDLDGDTYRVTSGTVRDCDDTTASTYPGAADTWYDGVDSNCDGASDFDKDGDGFDAEGQGGLDCNDEDTAVYPGLPDCHPFDTDGDTVFDYLETANGMSPTDPDSDDDGLPDRDEWRGGADTDLDTLVDAADPDSDGDGLPDTLESDPDRNADGWREARDSDQDEIPDHRDDDDDGDGMLTRDESTEDSDGDGLADYLDPDSDNDGVADNREGGGDDDGDGIPNNLDNGSGADSTEAPPEFPSLRCDASTANPGVWTALLGLIALRRRQPLRKK